MDRHEIRANCSNVKLRPSSRHRKAKAAKSGATGESSSQAWARYSERRRRKAEHRSPKRDALSTLFREASNRALSLSRNIDLGRGLPESSAILSLAASGKSGTDMKLVKSSCGK